MSLTLLSDRIMTFSNRNPVYSSAFVQSVQSLKNFKERNTEGGGRGSDARRQAGKVREKFRSLLFYIPYGVNILPFSSEVNTRGAPEKYII